MYEKFGQFIDGKWSPSENKETYEVINPATEEVIGQASKATSGDVERALKSAEKGLQIKAYIMGNYTEKAFQGFLKDPSSDRKAVVEQLTKAMGGTMHSMDIVRGSYDFIVVTDVPSFEDFAAIKLVVEASGAVKNLTILEAIDFAKATTKASKIGYKAPGQ